MGSHQNISHDKFPKQGRHLNHRVKVMFHYSEPYHHGKCIRDDMEEPYQTIFMLDDGRVVLSTECQYSIENGASKEQFPAYGGRL